MAHARVERDRFMREPLFAPHFSRWHDPWEFADAATTKERLLRAGFVDVDTSVEYSPVVQPGPAEFSEFVEHVICRPHLAHLPAPTLRHRFLDRLTEDAARDGQAFELDYWRLNVDARKPG